MLYIIVIIIIVIITIYKNYTHLQNDSKIQEVSDAFFKSDTTWFYTSWIYTAKFTQLHSFAWF